MPPKKYTQWKLRSAAEEIDRRAANGTLRSLPTSASSSSSSSSPSSSSALPSSSNSSSAASTGSASPLPSSGHQKLSSQASGNCFVPGVRPASQSALPSTSTVQPSSRSVARSAPSTSRYNQSVPAVAENTGFITSQTVDPQLQAEKIAELNKLEKDKKAVCGDLDKLEIQIGKEIKKRDQMIARDMKKV